MGDQVSIVSKFYQEISSEGKKIYSLGHFLFQHGSVTSRIQLSCSRNSAFLSKDEELPPLAPRLVS